MFSFFRSSPENMQVNESEIALEKKETILSAALRNGINFPYSCKVGGCAECKCKLISGKVKEYTDASYLLTAEEVQSGYILACQSVPKTNDVSVEVDLSRASKRLIRGKIISQERHTHDITALEITLNEVPIFKAGQYARLSLESLPGVTRAYSFASMPSPHSHTVKFYIRYVPEGVFSTVIHEQELVNTEVELESPLGDFYLRDSQKPMLLIAGGSGLAPILSILEKAKDEGCDRAVTILLGARTQADIYGIKEIDVIAKDWLSDFQYKQILSAEPSDSDWQGMRGFIGDHLHSFTTGKTQAYLCGPPLMIDDCMEKLSEIGIAATDIFADRFITNTQ